MKTCTKCLTEKSLDCYGLRPSGRPLTWCKDCFRGHYAAWRQANPDARRAIRKRYNDSHRELVRERSRMQYRANRAAYKANLKEWRSSNPDKYLTQKIRRRVLEAAAVVEHVDIERLIVRDGGNCGICMDHVTWGEPSVDHIIPLSRGGAHSYANTQLAHRLCNSRKHNSMPVVA